MSANIFPPILDSYQPAFTNNSQSYNIYFELSGLTNINSVKNIQIKLVYQETNQSAVNTSTYPDDIVYLSSSTIGFDQSVNMYYVTINSSYLDNGSWKPGIYYRVQLRFGLSELFVGLENFFQWKSEQIKQGLFSEWSTAMVLRPIAIPSVEILNNRVFSSGLIIDATNTETSYTPTFFGRYSCATYEPVDQYKFNLYNIDGDLIETSGWLQYNLSDNTPIEGETDYYSCAMQHRFKTILQGTIDANYMVNMEVITRNLYEAISDNYIFNIDVNPIDAENPFTITCYDSTNEPKSRQGRCNGEGVIDVYLDNTLPGVPQEDNKGATGNFVLVRSDERSNFSVWDDLTYLTYSSTILSNQLIYSDYAIESGINYKYGILYENPAGLRSELVTEAGNHSRQSNFEYSYIYDDGVQLKLKFDNTISSYKKTVLVSKQDTLGSKYPTIMRNGNAYYQEFSLSGLITLHMDDLHSFFKYNQDLGYYYKDELVIPSDKYKYSYTETFQYIPSRGLNDSGSKEETVPRTLNTFDHNLTDNNRFIEKVFRDKVEEFLNESRPKLYKSSTEGNFIIGLTNVSMTPKAELNRLIYNFTATAYEIMDFSLENLIKYGIVPFNDFQAEISTDEPIFGQISGFYTGEYSRDVNNEQRLLYPNASTPVNLVEVMAEQIATSVNEERLQRTITSIESIWVEPYPKLDFSKQLIECDAIIAAQKNLGEDADLDIIQEQEKIKEDILTLQEETEQSGIFPYYTLIINGQEIQMIPNRTYHIDNMNLNAFSDIHLKYSGAILVNYICKTATIDNPEEVEYGNATVKVWNQIAGMFTEKDSILINYDYDANVGINILPAYEEIIPEYQVHNFEDHNIGVYKTLDIMDIIYEEAAREVERTQNIVFTEVTEKVDDTTGRHYLEYTDGQYYYNFGYLTALSIEGEAGTPVKITSYDRTGGVNGKQITHYIGSTNKLVFKDIENRMIQHIELEDPQYLIVDFSANVILTVKGQQVENQEVAAYGRAKLFTR